MHKYKEFILLYFIILFAAFGFFCVGVLLLSPS